MDKKSLKLISEVLILVLLFVGALVVTKSYTSRDSPLEEAGAAGPGEIKKIQATTSRPRARQLGIEIGIFEPGKYNAITDVKGVKVGQATLVEGDSVRTGVTAILPHSGNLYQQKVPAAVYCGNAFGKLTGSTQVRELGNIETPILLTNTLSIPDVANSLIDYTLSLPGNENVKSVNPVVGETNDGYLNDIRARAVKKTHVFEAIENAKAGPVEEGSVGAGTGTRCLGWKGGIGTSSRILPKELGGWTVGVLVQTNFGGALSVNGAPVGRELGNFAYNSQNSPRSPSKGGSSCMIVVATDAPLGSRDLERLAKRALYGIARTGGFSSHGSGDYVIAFSTSRTIPNEPGGEVSRMKLLNSEYCSPLFCAVVEATEEAIINSLLKATTVVGYQGHRSEAIPIGEVVRICDKYNVLHWNSRLPPFYE